MIASAARTWCDGQVIELDGPPSAYFEIPLDLFATPNGELEPPSHPQAVRLTALIHYVNFHVPKDVSAEMLKKIEERLRELGGGYIWWRQRPRATPAGTWTFRLGTSPQLPKEFWARLSRDFRNEAGLYPSLWA